MLNTLDNVCCAGTLIIRCNMLTEIAYSKILCCSAHSVVRDCLEYRKVFACWMPKDLTHDNTAHFMEQSIVHLRGGRRPLIAKGLGC